MFAEYAVMFMIPIMVMMKAEFPPVHHLKNCPQTGLVLFAGLPKMNSLRSKDDPVKRPGAALRCISPRPAPGQACCDVRRKYVFLLDICAPCLRPFDQVVWKNDG